MHAWEQKQDFSITQRHTFEVSETPAPIRALQEWSDLGLHKFASDAFSNATDTVLQRLGVEQPPPPVPTRSTGSSSACSRVSRRHSTQNSRLISGLEHLGAAVNECVLLKHTRLVCCLDFCCI